MPLDALYFDGKTSRAQNVTLSVNDGVASLTGDAERTCPIADLRVSERARNTVRKVTFPDGAYLEISDVSAFNQLLAQTGYQDSPVVRMQQSWRWTFIAIAATVVVLALGYLYGLPAAARIIAHAMPVQVERAIGRETLSLLDRQLMQPTELPAAQRAAIVERFKQMLPPRDGVPDYEIVFRKSPKLGPNALALPTGQIVMTDELVRLMDDQDAVVGVLAHELGHLHERHLMQRLVQASAIAAIAAGLFGDVSSILVTVPTVVLDMKYSRDAEREADDYALAMLKANGMSAETLARGFEKLGAADKGMTPPPYLSSHPSTDERVARIRGTK